LQRCAQFYRRKLAGIDSKTIAQAREGRSVDAKTQAALSFARALVADKGHVSDSEVDSLKKAGYTDAAIAEIIAHTGFNIFTNYFNNALKVALDFPQAELVEAAIV